MTLRESEMYAARQTTVAGFSGREATMLSTLSRVQYAHVRWRPNNQKATSRRKTRIAAQDRDGYIVSALSPFDIMDQQMRFMDQQMARMQAQMDREFGSIFGDTRQLEQHMDSEIGSLLDDARRLRQQADLDAKRAMQDVQQMREELLRMEPGVRIERSEQRSSSSYRYYESIQISSGTGARYLAPTPAAPTMFSPLLFAATLLVGAYAALAAAFARNFDLTMYSNRGRWVLPLLWPFLFAFHKGFRSQFMSVLQGKPPKILSETDSSQS